MSKMILVTGASTGIGAAVAGELAADNTVFIHYNRSAEEAVTVAETVTAQGGTPHVMQADLTSEAGCRQLYTAVKEKTGRLDVLVNNAGGMISRHFVTDLQWDLIEDIFRLNTFSAMMMTSLCVPLLEKGESPCIINLTSIAMRSGAPSAAVYGASKGALDSFTRGSARELAPKIRVNAVAPGVILTPFHDTVTTPDKLESFRQSIPLGELGLAGQIADTVRFLMENEFITGETIDVNGGHSMR